MIAHAEPLAFDAHDAQRPAVVAAEMATACQMNAEAEQRKKSARAVVLRVAMRRVSARLDRPGMYAARSPYHGRRAARLQSRLSRFASEYDALRGWTPEPEGFDE